MRNRKTLADLEKLRRAALDPQPIEKMIAIVEQELGYRLYDAVGQVKRELSSAEAARFTFEGGGLAIQAEVTRHEFETWISSDVARIEAALEAALSSAGLCTKDIDRVFLTGGSSLVPRIRRVFQERFGGELIASGNELTSIAHGLALIGELEDLTAWAA
jgi:hypothetical chaperone protein